MANIIKRNVRGKKDGRILILRDFLIDLSVELLKDNPNFQFTTFIDAIGKDIIGVDWRFNKNKNERKQIICVQYLVLQNQKRHISDDQLRLLHKSFTSIASNACQRGTDSTGVVIISSTGRHLFKTLDSSDDAVLKKEWQTEVLNNIDKNTISVIGHTRAATTGDVTIRNAHPFKYGHIVGAHNGMIQNWDEIKGHKDKMQVDSEIIFGRLSHLKYKDALEELLGYYAVSFVDHNPRALHLAKETTAPLRLSYWKKAKTLFWGSTDSILKDGLKSHGLNLKTWNMPDDAILRFDTTRFNNKPFYTKQDIKPKQRYVSYNNAWNRNSYTTYTGWNNVWRNPSENTKIECDRCGKKILYERLTSRRR